MNKPNLALDIWSCPKETKKKLDTRWEEFLSGNQPDPGVRSIVLESWQRCKNDGVDPLLNQAPIILEPDDAKHTVSSFLWSENITSAATSLCETVTESGHLIVLCDGNGTIVGMDGTRKVQAEAEKMNFIIGASWAEKNAGTNAIGTALAVKSPVQIFASEHFCQDVHGWTCSAAPILDPITREVLGVIDLTGPWDFIHPHSMSTVISAAQVLNQFFKNQAEHEKHVLLEHCLYRISHYRGAPFAILDRGGHVVKSSPVLMDEGLLKTSRNNQPLKLVGSPSMINHHHTWDSEGKTGVWKLTLEPYYHCGRFIGAIVFVAQSPRLQMRRNVDNNTKETSQADCRYSFSSIIGDSPDILRTIHESQLSSTHDLPVLIEGESGTGKELFAQSIHSSSARHAEPFVAINCGALPRDLAISELFGFTGGSFTGAAKEGREGKFLQANGGTLFLDEIGELSLDLQKLLLRALEEQEIAPIGSQKSIPVNVRIIAATNRNLLQEIESGCFRRDLYYRLSVCILKVPPLRQRRDITLLFKHFLNRACAELGKAPLGIDESCLNMLMEYNWPGNVRELRNIAYRIAAHTTGNRIGKLDLPAEIISKEMIWTPSAPKEQFHIRDQELQTISLVLTKCGGNVSKAAKALGIHRSTLYRKMKEYGVRLGV